jgi:hypothetical protein
MNADKNKGSKSSRSTGNADMVMRISANKKGMLCRLRAFPFI